MAEPQPYSDNTARCETLGQEITRLAGHLHAATYRNLCLLREKVRAAAGVGKG